MADHTDKIDRGEELKNETQEEQQEDLSITLEFDDGEKVVVEPLFIFNLDGRDYIALIPTEEESDDVYLYIYHELSDDEFEFLDIESDEEFDRVSAEFERILEESGGLED